MDELAGVIVLHVICENCGRQRRLGSDQVRAFSRSGIGTIHGLGSRLACSACQGRGKDAKNISLVPLLKPDFQPRQRRASCR